MAHAQMTQAGSMTMEAMAEKVTAYDKPNFDNVVEAKDICVYGLTTVEAVRKSLESHDGKLVPYIGTKEGKVPMTYHAAQQLAKQADISSATFKELWEKAETKGRPEFFTLLCSQWADYREGLGDKEHLLRFRGAENGTPTICRAVLSDRYAPISNTHYVNALREILPEVMKDARFSGMKNQFTLDRDGFKCKLLIPNAEITEISTRSGRPHSLGLLMGNNEVGLGSCSGAMAIGDHHCTNQLRAGKEGMFSFSQRHVGKSLNDQLMDILLEQLRKAILAAPSEFQKYWGTREMRLENPAEALMEVQDKIKLGSRLATKIIDEKLPSYIENCGPTVFALAGSITEYARDLKETDVKQAEVMEKRAGALVSLPQKVWTPYLVSRN